MNFLICCVAYMVLSEIRTVNVARCCAELMKLLRILYGMDHKNCFFWKTGVEKGCEEIV